MATDKKRIYAIVGPTASGKTALSIEIAKRLGCEIISCDSMQIYKGMDIGTAKPTSEEMQGIPHHMLDVVDPDVPFSSEDYTILAAKCIDDIISRGKTPLFCGGTASISVLRGTGTVLSVLPHGWRMAEKSLKPTWNRSVFHVPDGQNWSV